MFAHTSLSFLEPPCPPGFFRRKKGWISAGGVLHDVPITSRFHVVGGGAQIRRQIPPPSYPSSPFSFEVVFVRKFLLCHRLLNCACCGATHFGTSPRASSIIRRRRGFYTMREKQQEKISACVFLIYLASEGREVKRGSTMMTRRRWDREMLISSRAKRRLSRRVRHARLGIIARRRLHLSPGPRPRHQKPKTNLFPPRRSSGQTSSVAAWIISCMTCRIIYISGEVFATLA